MFANVTLSLMGGFVTTVQLFCLTLVFALPRPGYQLRLDEPHYTAARTHQNHRLDSSAACRLYSQIIIIFYGPALLWDISLPRFTAALVAFVINYACYFSETFPRRHSGYPERSV